MVRLLSACVTVVLLCWSVATSAAVIMMYHHVDESTPAATSVTPAQFSDHLQALKQNGFEVLRLDHLLERMAQGQANTDRLVAITFDDAYRSIYETALPLLQDYGWQATIFINTDAVGRGSGSLTMAMLRDMHQRGHLLANHSQSHAHLVRRNAGESVAQWRRRVLDEINGAAATLTEWLGEAPPPWFAYPYGEQSAALRALLAEHGWLGFAQHSGAVGPDTDWQNIPRVAINQQYAAWPSLKDKLLALPLPVLATQPADGITIDARPQLALTLSGDWRRRDLNCFVSGRPATPNIAYRQKRSVVTLVSAQDIAPGRSRYTCTAPAIEGRYYWYSWVWIRRAASGDWYHTD